MAALVSVALPIFDVPRHVEGMVELHEKWCQLLNQYEDIWTNRASMADADVQEKLRMSFQRRRQSCPVTTWRWHQNVYDVLRERHLPPPQQSGARV